jgi:hypothetical protein
MKKHELFVYGWLVEHMGCDEPELHPHVRLMEDIGMEEEDIADLVISADERFSIEHDSIMPICVQDVLDYCARGPL